SSRRRHTRFSRDWSSDVCSSDLEAVRAESGPLHFQIDDAMLLFVKIEKRHVFLNIFLCKQDFQRDASRIKGIGNQSRFFRNCIRSEERRVGKECSYRWSRENEEE